MSTTTDFRSAPDICDDPLWLSLNAQAVVASGGVAYVDESLQPDLQLAADCDVPVLVSGGRLRQAERVALWIHRRSPRCDEPFVAVDTRHRELEPAIIDSLRCGEPFGVRSDDVVGRALGGTLFIAHIEEMSSAMQVALFHFLERPERRRGAGPRLIASGAASAFERVQTGRFRADLYYRLNVIHIAIPSPPHLRPRRQT